MRDNHCTWCNQPGHRASHCPRRAPWCLIDLLASITVVALIVGVVYA